ncbi:MAG: hypothetical protein R2706_01495 [Acidimicrobiales bacterium]
MFPEEVEEALKGFPTVVDAIAVGVPDERFGQAIVAIVEKTANSEVDEAAIIEFIKTKLAPYKAPDESLASTR